MDAPTLDFYVKTRCKTSNGAGYKRAETNPLKYTKITLYQKTLIALSVLYFCKHL